MNIYVNGTIIEEEKAVVSVYDHGFLYGMGLFETFRTYNGQPFLLDLHQRRLLAGCKQLGIAYKPQAGEWEDIIADLLLANHQLLSGKDAYIRFTVTAGQDILGLPAGEYTHPHVVVYIKAIPPKDKELYRTGKPLQLLKLARNTPEGPLRLKSLHYMNNILAKQEMRQYPWAGSAEGLFTDSSGSLAEGIVSNLFFTREGKLFTPALETGILPGITRDYVLALAERAGVQTEEGFFTWSELLRADEVFITNSIQEIVPVTSLFDAQGNCRRVSEGTAGSLTRRFIQLYERDTSLLS
ncbi:aminodeoxychorismate lyase [Paenibacillus rigui]|uniref:4-amino-4-deoxychorismate lyase n=1 Tax=Paenibacillus rigui TaxID=554312 RepID=A0A229UHV0_9BACL|nr:aminodeoxychorismate lyase [Paenibacillus rigui]OXM82479.1 4-amino-4-deoxychorismate lyase [Paenibacillus rigui]